MPSTHKNQPTARGGPRTPAGKTRSRGNALKHGLAATTLLPAILGPDQNLHLLRLRAEWQPTTATEEFLVAELARHAALLEFIAQAEPAVLRCGANVMPLVQFQLHAMDSGAIPENTNDLLLAAAVGTEAIDRITRYRRAHEKGWQQAFQRLRELRQGPVVAPRNSLVDPPFPFTDAACQDYLCRRLQSPEFRCPHCGHQDGYWLAKRQRWECAACRQQIGLRTGTVMERSSLPLSPWFVAVWQLLNDTDTPLEKLMVMVKRSRPRTVRGVHDKIRSALTAPNAHTLLAGLDQIFQQRRT